MNKFEFTYDCPLGRNKKCFDGANLMAFMTYLAKFNAKNGISRQILGYACPACGSYHTTSTPLKGKTYMELTNGTPTIKKF